MLNVKKLLKQTNDFSILFTKFCLIWLESFRYRREKNISYPDDFFKSNISSIFQMVVESSNRQHHSQTIHSTEKLISMNLFKILCVVTCRAAGTYKDMRTGSHHVFSILGETFFVYFSVREQKHPNQFLSFLAFEIMLHLI